MIRAREDAIRAALPIQDVLRDWRYKAGVEDGALSAGAKLRHLEAQRDLALTEFYRADPVKCAELCDGQLDTSGRLLGQVREWALLEEPQQP